jgi:hypothetical protein
MMIKKLVCLIFLIFGMFSAVANATPVLWSGNGHYYDVSTVSLRWSEALNYAEGLEFNGLNGHLVTITSADEDAFILGLDLPENYYYTGALQLPNTTDPRANWTWITGEAWVYENWVGQEPNDMFGAEDNMVVMKGASGWGDINGDDINYAWTSNKFIIEYETSAVPEPNMLLLLVAGIIGLVALRKRYQTKMS